MTTSPFLTLPFLIPAFTASSPSNTLAIPLKNSPSFPVIFATAPSAAKLPNRIRMWPVSFIGLSNVLTMSWPSIKLGTSFKFSSKVLPVTVKQLVCNIPLSNIYFSTPGIPPTACNSSMEYFPLGLRSAKRGVLSLNLLKSSRVNSTLAAFAMAKKWRTALVDPPSTVTNLNAFSKDFLLTISDGLMSLSNNRRKASPALTDSFSFNLPSLTAGFEELKVSDIPKASMAEAMVLAVYMPPQAPAPGHALWITSLNSDSSIVPATFWP